MVLKAQGLAGTTTPSFGAIINYMVLKERKINIMSTYSFGAIINYMVPNIIGI